MELNFEKVKVNERVDSWVTVSLSQTKKLEVPGY